MERVLAVLEGTPGVLSVRRDDEPKTVRVLYDPSRLSAAMLVDTINRADLRLEAHHAVRRWFGRSRREKARTARLIDDREMTE